MVSGGSFGCFVAIRRLSDGRTLVYKQAEGAFSNPNAFMAESTLEWLCDCSRTVVRERIGGGGDDTADGGIESEKTTSTSTAATSLPSLLELYCGNGNHTVALSAMYQRVAAVVGEASRALRFIINHTAALFTDDPRAPFYFISIHFNSFRFIKQK